jgi:hypothetical protein
MGHRIRVFAGEIAPLQQYLPLLGEARLYRLRRDAAFAVLPLDNEELDILHAAYGKGEWLAGSIELASGDADFARRASVHGLIAYFETDYFGGTGSQAAALWRNGEEVMAPDTHADGQHNPRDLPHMPVNTVLRAMGVAKGREIDEFDAFGLGNYRSNDAIRRAAFMVELR